MKLVPILLAVLFLSFFAFHVQAAEIKKLEADGLVTEHKDWTITFSTAYDEELLSALNVFVENSKGVTQDVTIEPINAKQIKVHAPEKGYVLGETYSLFIMGLQSVNGHALDYDYIFNFSVDASLEPDHAMYYTVNGTDTISSGIYKAEPSGTSTLVIKENVYDLKENPKPAIAIGDLTHFFQKGDIATEDFEWAINPIKSVQAVGTDLYYTNYLFSGEYAGGCGGGYTEIQELFKRDASGKITKVTDDKVSSSTQDQFFVSGSSIYYAKVENKAFSNFTIVKMNLTDNSKATLATGVVDFWVKQNTIYLVKDGKLQTMDLSGNSIQTVSNLNAKLYGRNGCGDSNYTVSNNGLAVEDYANDEDVTYFYDFATKAVNALPVSTILDTLNGYPNILDVDVKNKRFAAYVYDYDSHETILGIYDFNGKLIKELKKVDYWLEGLLSIDVQKGEFLYVEGSQLKLIKF